MKFTILPIILFGIVACSTEDRAQMEAEKLDQFELTNAQRDVTEALIEGYKKDTGMPILRSQDYARAACYAKSVKMPSRYTRAHLLYLKNYPDADEDFYGFFQKHKVPDQLAYDMSQIFQKGYDACSNTALIKRFMQKKN